MNPQELEEKVTMLEELFQGFQERVNSLDTETQAFFKSFLQQYQATLKTIVTEVARANQRYDDQKIQQQIDEVKKIMATVPKVITVKNSHDHHFGAWSKSLIIGVVVCFVITAGSVGTALYLNNQNDQMNGEAYNFWLVRALYPKTAETILTRLQEDPKDFIALAEKEMAKQQAIIAAKAQADEADKAQKEAKENLDKANSGK